MKTIKFLLLAITALTISTIFCACDNDDTTPITLKDRDDTTIKLYFPNDTKYSFSLQGGDGSYSVKSGNNEVVKVEMISAIDFSVELIGLGETQITVTDKSQNSLTLDVIVDYLTYNYIVEKHEIQITGNELTENEKKAISEEYLTEIPVKIGGGYTFIFTDINKGEVLIYADKFGDNAIRTTFERRIFDGYWAFDININDEIRTFYYLDYITPSTQSSLLSQKIDCDYRRKKFMGEDITEKVQAKYPKAEQVISVQIIEISTY